MVVWKVVYSVGQMDVSLVLSLAEWMGDGKVALKVRKWVEQMVGNWDLRLVV